MKKIIKSGFIVLAVAAIAGYGTYSYFSDTEKSTGNTFRAGSIDLKVDSTSMYNGNTCVGGLWTGTSAYPVAGSVCSTTWGQVTPGVDITGEKFFSFMDLKPGDQGANTISLHVINNDARACVVFDKMQNDDNGLTEPETSVDTTGGVGQGELAQALNVFAWNDVNNNNVQDTSGGEGPLFATPYYGPASDVLNGKAYDLGTLTGATTKYLGLYWCYGTIGGINTGALTCNGSAVTNVSQTDSLVGDVWFYIEQARNNTNFVCPAPRANVITANDLETDRANAKANGKWFFYNDTNDTVMTPNEFSGTGGANEIVALTDSNGAAKMVLGNETNPRYNIATYRYNDVKLANISSLKYRIYDTDPTNGTPYLHFNVDFNNTDTWQSRLIQVPTGLSANTWADVDALAGSWAWSGFAKGPDGIVDTVNLANPVNNDNNTWPVGAGSFDETIANHPWSEILAAYPNAETRSTDSWFGVRVGQPGPAGDTGYVDWIELNGEKADFGL